MWQVWHTGNHMVMSFNLSPCLLFMWCISVAARTGTCPWSSHTLHLGCATRYSLRSTVYSLFCFARFLLTRLSGVLFSAEDRFIVIPILCTKAVTWARTFTVHTNGSRGNIMKQVNTTTVMINAMIMGAPVICQLVHQVLPLVAQWRLLISC